MLYNPMKCNAISISRKRKLIVAEYHLKGDSLAYLEVTSYVGVQLSQNLTWHNHIVKYLLKTTNYLDLYVSLQYQHIINNHYKTLVYQTLERFSVEYASSV